MMYGAEALEEIALSKPPAATDGLAKLRFQNHSLKIASLRESHCEGIDMRSNGLNGRSFVPQSRKKTSIRDGKQENQDWLAAEMSRRSVAQVVGSTGMTEKAVQNIRRGKSKISFDGLTDLLKSDPEFAAEYFAYVGMIMPGDAEWIGAFNRAAQARARRMSP